MWSFYDSDYLMIYACKFFFFHIIMLAWNVQNFGKGKENQFDVGESLNCSTDERSDDWPDAST